MSELFEQRYCLVGDDSGHEYYIPEEKTGEWYRLMELPDDDPDSPCYAGEVPDWAKSVDGNFTFTDPRCD